MDHLGNYDQKDGPQTGNMNHQKHLIWLQYSILLLLGVYGCTSLDTRTLTTDSQTQLKSVTLTTTARGLDPTRISESPKTNPTSTISTHQITDELNVYGILPTTGQIGWIHPPAILISDQEQQLIFRYEYPTIIARNLVLAGDINWDNLAKPSGCGFSFRVHGEGLHPSLYLIILTRIDKGYILFTALDHGNPANLRELYANGIDPILNTNVGGTNHLAVIAQDKKVSVYLNRTFISVIDLTSPPLAEPNLPPRPTKPTNDKTSDDLNKYLALEAEYQSLVQLLDQRYKVILKTFEQVQPIYEVGYAGLAAFNSSGITSCKFSNSWLWIMDSK